MKRVALCFLWHMHQPYYTDPVTGSASMPWVRLHATKAYFDMAFLPDRFPRVSATFNFTPSLLRQLEELTAGTITDVFLEHARKPAAELSPAERAFVIRHFFSANWATMVRPAPRYQELLVKRGMHVAPQDLEPLAKRFTTQELLDLQVWHNLAWFGYGALHRFPHLADLRKKGRSFSEQDKADVLDLQLAVMREVVPSYRKLAARGQIELTTSPFYHPILPLLIDTEIARRSLPHLPALPQIKAPADAEAQIRKAVEYHTHVFGEPPRGLWPSEGSVCPELVPLLHQNGLRWFATDEGMLARSIEMQQGPWHRSVMLYQPYEIGDQGRSLRAVFRDRDFSDAFGFRYQRTLPQLALEDVIRRLRTVPHESPREDLLIPVILDGENPWEHYHDGGEEFLSLLYQKLAAHAADEPGHFEIRTKTLSDALKSYPAPAKLSHLHSGSWINADFKIWIGHGEDQRGWELLRHTRERLLEVSSSLDSDASQAAWEELYAAEGSDWFWWYGDEFESDYKLEFDRLFRAHLRNVWTKAGLVAPDYLHHPLVTLAPAHVEDLVTMPTALISPVLDGMVTDFFEWYGAGSVRAAPPLGAMWSPTRYFASITFGFNLDRLFLRLDPDRSLKDQEPPLSVEWDIRTNARAYKVSFPLIPPAEGTFLLSRGVPGEAFEYAREVQGLARQRIIEVAVPFRDLELTAGRTFTFSLLVTREGLELARYPHHHPVTLEVPTPDFDAMMWRV